MKKHQVIFVETQGRILEGLRTKLASAHPEWRILLSVDSAAALELILQRSVSIVLANFGDDRCGCEDFFRTIKNNTPEVIRMGLLHDIHKEALANSLEYAHECIAAHCDPKQFEAVISRGLSVWERTRKNPRLAALISDLHTLPTTPALYFDIRDELESPNGTAQSVAQIIARDPAIAAKLLKVANSGFYAMPRTISDLYETINLLGMDMVLAIVLSAHLYDQLPLPGLNLDVLWVHSIAVATLAKKIALEEGGDRAMASTCGIAGLLHDLGTLMFLANVPQSYYSMVRRSGGDERVLLEMELEQFGVGHPELGAHILSLWGLPEDVVQAVAYHHVEDRQSFMDATLPIKAVCIAEWLLQVRNVGDEMVAEGNFFEDRSLIDEASVQRWKYILDSVVEQGLIHQPYNIADKLLV